MSINGHYKDHALAAILPLMEEADLKELAEDIAQNGLRTPITLYENEILDGRNRARACAMVNVEPRVRHWSGGDPVAFIVSANVKRRHLTESQRAMVAAKIESMKQGRSPAKDANLHVSKSRAEAAQELNVSPRSVATAKQVLRDAPKKDVAAIERGDKTVGGVAKEIKAKAEAKKEHLDNTGYPIPESILEDWQRAEAQRELLTKISDVRTKLGTALENHDCIFAEITNSTIADLNNAYGSLKCVIPYAVCTTCQGLQRDKCALCRRRGFLSKFAWDRFVAPEVKAMREKK